MSRSSLRNSLILCAVLSLGASIQARAAAAADPNPLAFKSSGAGFRFDTGTLQGTLHEQGKALGLKSLRFADVATTVSGAYGIFSPYRLLTAEARFGVAGWDWASRAELLPDGAVQVAWQPDALHPLAMTARYRWAAHDTLDLQVTVQPRRDLKNFEFFLASYFNGFPAAFAWVQAAPGSGDKSGFMAALKANGDWQTFARDGQSAALFADGRWKHPPNPVEWKVVAQPALPLALRRDEASGLTAVLMAPPRECFAVSMPQSLDNHRSVYLSLFGRDLASGEKATARARLVIGKGISDEMALTIYQAYIKEQGSR